eukprot:jgi/Bigna1/68415/fgenesh1_pg.6_\
MGNSPIFVSLPVLVKLTLVTQSHRVVGLVADKDSGIAMSREWLRRGALGIFYLWSLFASSSLACSAAAGSECKLDVEGGRVGSKERSIQVPSRPLWVESGVDVQAGDLVTISASGEWTDWYINCSADGYKFPSFLQSLLRHPEAKCFALIACVGKDLELCTHASSWRASKNGEIMLFANDVPRMYWNNYGALQVHIAVQRSQQHQ